MIHLIIEGEPVAKGRPRFSVRGGYIRTFTPEKTKNFEEIVGTIARLKIKKPFPKENTFEITNKVLYAYSKKFISKETRRVTRCLVFKKARP